MPATIPNLGSSGQRAMVYLNRIYTRGGDDGMTSLGDGSRVTKTHQRILAYGGVDELNAVLGVALTDGLPEPIAGHIRTIQNDLFDLGADLCVPEADPDAESTRNVLRISQTQVDTLERWIDEANDRLEPLTSFILPGGTAAAARLHHARTVCRRIEIGIVMLSHNEAVNPTALQYVNRLSDLLFVYARHANDEGRGDVLWQPGENQ